MNGSGSKLAIRIGVWLMIAALAALAGYAVYLAVRDLFTEPDVPLAIRVAVPVVIAGALMLFGAVFVQKIQRRKQENVEEGRVLINNHNRRR